MPMFALGCGLAHVRGKLLSWWWQCLCPADVPKDQRLQAIKAEIGRASCREREYVLV